MLSAIGDEIAEAPSRKPRKKRLTNEQRQAASNARFAAEFQATLDGIDAVQYGSPRTADKRRTLRKLDAVVERIVARRNFLAQFAEMHERYFGDWRLSGSSRD